MPDSRREPVWLELGVAIAVHEEQLAEHGGASGVRDGGALQSALARPRNGWAHDVDDPFKLAAAYAFGIARNHPFVDGNKRTAFVAALLFLALNGNTLEVDREEGIVTFLALASGELEEDELADWFRQRIAKA